MAMYQLILVDQRLTSQHLITRVTYVYDALPTSSELDHSDVKFHNFRYLLLERPPDY